MDERPRFYLDEDVSVVVGEMLSARGYDVLTTRDARNLAAGDEEQLVYAANNGRVLVTHNRVDFERMIRSYFDEDRRHCGVLLATRRPARELSFIILRALKDRTADNFIDQVLYL